MAHRAKKGVLFCLLQHGCRSFISGDMFPGQMTWRGRGIEDVLAPLAEVVPADREFDLSYVLQFEIEKTTIRPVRRCTTQHRTVWTLYGTQPNRAGQRLSHPARPGVRRAGGFGRAPRANEATDTNSCHAWTDGFFK